MKMLRKIMQWMKYKPYDGPRPVWLSLCPGTAEKAIAFGEKTGMIRAICTDGTCYGLYTKSTIYPRDIK